MRTRMLRACTALALMGVLAAGAVVLTAQQRSGGSVAQTTTDTEAAIKAAEETARKEAEALKNWKPSRTAWGDPDLRGVWHLATYTPLQRPVELGEKAVYTDEEALNVFKQRVERDAEVDPRTVHYDWKEYGMDGWQGGARPNLRTSLIVEPSNGRLPPRTPAWEQGQVARAAAAKLRDPAAGIQTFGNTYTRCVLGNGAIPLVRGGNPGGEGSAAGVTAEAQLFQSPGYVTIVTQSNNDIRIIPLDGRRHLPDKIRQWYGDARGRWEGNTLVVETTNFRKDLGAVYGNANPDTFKIVERFTRVSPDVLNYEFTISDPNTWTKPWTAIVPWSRINEQLYEYTTHEDNYDLVHLLVGARVREARGEKPPDPSSRPAGGGGGDDR